MSIAEIDATIYEAIYAQSVVWYINRGLDLIAARKAARMEMDFTFVRADVAAIAEIQKDADEYGPLTDAPDESGVVFRGGASRDVMK